MVEHLATLIESFPEAANQTRCFTHILNLVAKSILCQFDMAKKIDASPDLNNASDALASLALKLELELEDSEVPPGDDEDENDKSDEEDEGEGGNREDDNDEGLRDERDGMSEEDVAELEESIVPVQLMLTKVKMIT